MIWHSYCKKCFSGGWYSNDKAEQRPEKVRVSTSSIWSTVSILLLIKCQHHAQEKTAEGRKPHSKCHSSFGEPVSLNDSQRCRGVILADGNDRFLHFLEINELFYQSEAETTFNCPWFSLKIVCGQISVLSELMAMFDLSSSISAPRFQAYYTVFP